MGNNICNVQQKVCSYQNQYQQQILSSDEEKDLKLNINKFRDNPLMVSPLGVSRNILINTEKIEKLEPIPEVELRKICSEPQKHQVSEIQSENENILHSQQLQSIQKQIIELSIIPQMEKIKPKKKADFKSIKIQFGSFVEVKKKNIKEDYKFKDKIGKGGFGVVYKAETIIDQHLRAIKQIKKQDLTQEQAQNLMNEINILKNLDHPHIIKLFDVYEDKNYFYIVTQLCEGGSVLKYVNENKPNNEIIKRVMRQLLSAVKYMHSFKLLHRDLKLENLVMVEPYSRKNISKINIKVIDFGTALNISKVNIDDCDVLGTMIYMPPESFAGSYGLPWDIWSCGIILYTMLTRKMPYSYVNHIDLEEKVSKSNLNIAQKMKQFPFLIKQLIEMMLETNPSYRIKADKALKSRWLKSNNEPRLSQQIKKVVVLSLGAYNSANNFTSLIDSYLTFKKISQKQREQLAEYFEEIDEDSSGLIEISELRKFFEKNSQNYSEKQIIHIVNSLDKNKSGKIDFSEFLTAMYQNKHQYRIKQLEEAFDMFDIDKSGSIDKQQLKKIMAGIEKEELNFIFKELDKDEDQNISKTQFINYLRLEGKMEIK